jgi:phycoerythrin-associated linker protein
MDIDQFVAKSIGLWRSMRSGHSLAFQQFEDVLSTISISAAQENDPEIINFLLTNKKADSSKISSPFKMTWEAESDWNTEEESVSSGSCILIPLPVSSSAGLLFRSVGYAEEESAISEYLFLGDGTFILNTKYGQSIAEERIWFASDNLRCRSSVIRTSSGAGILQTSFASEVRKIQN